MLLGVSSLGMFLAHRDIRGVSENSLLVETNNASFTQIETFCTVLPMHVSCNVWTIGACAVIGALTGPVLVPLFFGVLCCAGFGQAGVIAGSIAAGCQTPTHKEDKPNDQKKEKHVTSTSSRGPKDHSNFTAPNVTLLEMKNGQEFARKSVCHSCLTHVQRMFSIDILTACYEFLLNTTKSKL